MLVVVAMLAVLGAVIGTVSVFALQGYLVQRLDAQLTSAVAARPARGRQHLRRSSPTGPDVTRIVATPGQPVGTFGVVRSGDMLLYPVILGRPPEAGQRDGPVAPQRVPIQAEALVTLPADGKPRTVNLGPSLGDYRVAASSLVNGDSVIIGLPAQRRERDRAAAHARDRRS